MGKKKIMHIGLYKNKHILRIILLLFIINFTLAPVVGSNLIESSTVIYVDDNKDADYTSIQDAIDNADDGDTIYVFNGTYKEQIIIDKKINLIGEDEDSTVITGDFRKFLVSINADDVSISNFNIIGEKFLHVLSSSIVVSSDNIKITNCIINHSNIGILIKGSDANISNNKILYCNIGLFFALNVNDNIVEYNNISDNFFGIWSFYSIISSGNIARENLFLKNNIGVNLVFLTRGFTVYHNNFVENNVHAKGSGQNKWNDNYPSSGNYWEGYSGEDYYHGINQDKPGSDGIIDDAYSQGHVLDEYPFKNNYGWEQNNPPFKPYNPMPFNGNSSVDIIVSLLWDGGDPEGDLVNYDVYFGTNPTSLSKVSDNQTDLSFTTGELEYETDYFWQIVAWDEHGENIKGDVWKFTTRQEENNNPVAFDDYFIISEDSSDNQFNVLENDTDIDGDLLLIDNTGSALHGTVTFDEDYIYYSPDENYCGSDSFEYTVSDKEGGFDTATVYVTVECINDAPVVQNIPNQNKQEGEEFSSFDLDNYVTDIDDLDNEITWTYSGNLELDVSIDTNHVVTVSKPNLEWVGAETIRFTATDSGGLFSFDDATFTSYDVNHDPVANDDIRSVSEDSDNNLFDVLENDYDPDGDSIIITSAGSALHGSVSFDEDYIYYTPNENYCGSDSILYTISDGNGGIDTATIAVTVSCINDPPVVSDIPDQTINQGASFATINLNNYVYDIEDSDSEITWTYSGNNDLQVSISTSKIATITQPSLTWTGQETITFTATDTEGLSDSDNVLFKINPTNNPPVANNDFYEINEDKTLYINAIEGVLSNDSDADSDLLTCLLDDDVSDGTLNLYANGSFRYIPLSNFNGEDSFRYKVSDGKGGFDTAVVKIKVFAVNDAPEVPYSPNPANNLGSVSLSKTLSWSCSDPDGDTITYSIYFGKTSSNIDFKKNQTSKTYNPGLLDKNTNYYWKIIAKDPEGLITEGPIWNFKTTSDTSTGDDDDDENTTENETYYSPTAVISGPFSGEPNVKVFFDGSKSHDNDEGKKSIVRYDWKFFENDTWHENLGDKPTYSYEAIGKYKVSLRVTDDEDEQATTTITIKIQEKNDPPTKPTITAGKEAKLSENYAILVESYDPDGDSIRFTIKWGDGWIDYSDFTNDSFYTGFHKYNQRGVYIITVQADDGDLKSDESSVLVFLEVNVLEIDDLIKGYFVDKDDDNYYDSFFNLRTREDDEIERHTYYYWVNSDPDKEWDYIYDSKEKTVYEWTQELANTTLATEENQGDGFLDGVAELIGQSNLKFLPIILIGAIIIIAETIFVTVIRKKGFFKN